MAQNRPVPRSRLVDLFWGEKVEQRGRGNLSRVLNNISSLLPDSIEADRQNVHYLRCPEVWVDLQAWDELAATADPLAMAEAVSLWRGDFLEGVYLDDCPDVETWITTERELWKQRIAAVTRSLTEYHAYRGEYELALQYATRLVELDPWSEEAHRWRMLYLARTGQHAAALKHYQACHASFLSELSIPPSTETEKLSIRIARSAERSIQLTGVGIAPQPALGRRRELGELRALLARPDCRFVTITGCGGVGKSHLAAYFIQSYPYDFLDGFALVQSAGITSSQYLLAAMAQALVLPDTQDGVTLQKLAAWIGDREMLLLIDNFDHLVQERSGAVRTTLWRLLEKAPGLKILITCRERVGLQAEWVYPMNGLPFQPDDFTDDPRNVPAFCLFEQYVRRVRPDRPILPGQVPLILEMCRYLDGLPLAIELAAALSADLTFEQLVSSIRIDLDLLATRYPDLPARHRSLRVVFQQSWKLLDPLEQLVFTVLSVFPYRFDLRAAAELVEPLIPPGELRRTEKLIKALLDKSLLVYANGYYSICLTLQRYAMERLSESTGRLESTRNAHSQYYMRLLLELGRLLSAGQPDAAVSRMQPDRENIRQAWDWAVELGWWELVTPAEEILFLLFLRSGWFKEGAEIFRAALRRLAGEPPWIEGLEPDRQLLAAKLMLREGVLRMRMVDPAAEDVLSASLEIFKALGIPEGMQMANQNLARESNE
jgi:predicted ATPase/DNA-binding SARP family transcriptional activator